MPDRDQLSDRGTRPLVSMTTGELISEIQRLRAELAAWKDENAGVMCEACGIHLNTARAGDAVEKRDEYGHVMCGACRDAADLTAENKRLRKALETIAYSTEHSLPPQTAYELACTAQQALSPAASTTKDASDA